MKDAYGCFGWGYALSTVVAVTLSAALVAPVGGQAPAKKGAAKAPAKAGEQPKFKAIWEPVNVPEDLTLLSVHFVSAEEGWVAGGKTTHEGGAIYHTKDGGKTWELQVGDPGSSDRAFEHLHFVDATHGFAIQGVASGRYKLYSTSDGQAWYPSGSVPEHRYDYTFTTPTTGYVADWARNIMRTTDGGKKWQSVCVCKIKTEISGLMRDAECYFNSISFPNPTVGYAIGALPDDGGNMLAKTEDGGVTWKSWVVLPGESSHEGVLWFLDETNGVFRAKDGKKMFRTADGGRTWNEVSGQNEPRSNISFADAEVGWMVRYNRMTYTGNGGKSWLSRQIAFPTLVAASSLPARDRGYAVGEHGMVYRYRIVPADYTAKGMLPAPALR